ncbi:hypothetical protein [Clostridium sp. UBA6640]|uniref:hypothetical protein n=1 Tax=Clostridium sp. UBA6640 TaxID=1946370 RepID=UPI0025C5A6A3|nr:hypothetical protein [Clostridium sp. UBA6640]
MDDGKINRGAKSYLKAAGVGALVGATAGFGYAYNVAHGLANGVVYLATAFASGVGTNAIYQTFNKKK